MGGTDPSSSSQGPSARQVVGVSIAEALLGPEPISLCAMPGSVAPVTQGDSFRSRCVAARRSAGGHLQMDPRTIDLVSLDLTSVVLYYTVLYCTVLHCTVLYCTAL